MKVAIIYNKDIQGVINRFGIQNKEFYNDATILKVASSLEKSGHNVTVFDGNKQIIERLESFMPRVVEGEQMGMVFNMAYGIQGESRYTHIPSMLEMLGIPYVGSSPSGHTLALDKVLTKIIWKNNNLPTPDFWVFNSPDEDISLVRYPVIVKPKMESVSFGLRVVDNPNDLRDAIEYIIKEFQQPALIEQFISGREFCVGLLGNSPVEAFPVLEIDLGGDPDAIQTVSDKKQNPKQKICPAPINNDLAEKMQKLSIEAFKALNLRDFSRVDIRLDQNNNIYLLEINSMASLGKTGSYVNAANAAGYNFEALANKMLDVATIRYFIDKHSVNDISKEQSTKTGKQARMRMFIKSRQEQTEKLLKKIVDINTYVRNVEGVNLCSNIIASALGSLGFMHEVFAQQEVGNMIYFSNTSDKKIDTLILTSIDNSTKLSHHENFQEHEQYVEGTGIWENKSGLVILLTALRSLKFMRTLRKTKIGILLITDSSINNKYSKPIIQQKAKNAKKVFGLSGSSKCGGIILSRSGSAQYKLEVKLLKRNDPENVSTAAISFNNAISSISGLSKNNNENVIAPYDIIFKSNIFRNYAYGSAGISVRFNNAEALKEIEKKITRNISVLKRDKKLHIHFEGSENRPPMINTEQNQKLYNKLTEITKQIDVRITKEHRWSSSDICHISSDLPQIDGLGCVGEYLPSGNEHIVRHSITERALLLALALL